MMLPRNSTSPSKSANIVLWIEGYSTALPTCVCRYEVGTCRYVIRTDFSLKEKKG